MVLITTPLTISYKSSIITCLCKTLLEFEWVQVDTLKLVEKGWIKFFRFFVASSSVAYVQIIFEWTTSGLYNSSCRTIQPVV